MHYKRKAYVYTYIYAACFSVEQCHATCQLLRVILPKYRCELLCVQWSLLQTLGATVQAYSIWLLETQKKYMIWCKFGMAIIIICDYDYGWLWKQSKHHFWLVHHVFISLTVLVSFQD